MHALALCLAVLGAGPTERKLFAADAPPPVASPPPLVVQFHEDAATKADIASLGEKIDAALQPLHGRLAAVESKTDALATDLAALKQRVERVESPPVAKTAATPKTPAPPTRTKWVLTDAEGIQCWGWDPDELAGRVAQRNAHFAARTTRIAQPAYESAPLYFGGSYSAPMFGGYTGGGCVGGNCR